MDEQLLATLLQRGDKEAYRTIFLTYYSPLCVYASTYVANSDAEELVQDLMLFVWESRENLIIENSLKSYLFAATRNRCLNAIQKRQYRQKVHHYIYEKLKEQFEEPDYYVLNELAENINKAIASLPEKYRETFELSRFGEKTNAQIAEELGVSLKTVEYRMTQSLKILRVKLKDYLPLLEFLYL